MYFFRKTSLQNLSYEAYLALGKNAQVIERDLHGDKVLFLKNGRYLKLLRRKRLLSSQLGAPMLNDSKPAAGRMTIDFPTAPLALCYKGADGGAVEKSLSALHTEILTSPPLGIALRELIKKEIQPL